MADIAMLVETGAQDHLVASERVVEAQQVVSELREQNAAKRAELLMHRFQLDPISELNTRLDAIVNAIWDPATEEGQLGQLRASLDFERTMEKVLDTALANKAKAILAQGGQVSPEMMEQMAKQAGLVKPDGRNGKRG